MKALKRLIYLGYYIKELDRPLYWKFVSHVARGHKRSKVALVIASIYSVFRYNISLLEYFQFHFYRISRDEKEQWAGTGFMYETILQLNPRPYRYVLSDKKKFANHYASFIRHSSQPIEEWLRGASSIGHTGLWMLKPSDGQCGRGIVQVDASVESPQQIQQLALATDNDMIEPYLEQHEALRQLSPSGLNTLRVITQINAKGDVDILGVRLRITVNSLVDNLAAGNIAAPIDEETGRIVGPGVYSDITKPLVEHHPVTGHQLIGYQVPFFEKSLDLAKAAAMHDTRNTSIGWDIAILQDGPDLLEGNHDWCKLLWQLPVQRGLKSVLQQYA